MAKVAFLVLHRRHRLRRQKKKRLGFIISNKRGFRLFSNFCRYGISFSGRAGEAPLLRSYDFTYMRTIRGLVVFREIKPGNATV